MLIFQAWFLITFLTSMVVVPFIQVLFQYFSFVKPNLFLRVKEKKVSNPNVKSILKVLKTS